MIKRVCKKKLNRLIKGDWVGDWLVGSEVIGL